MALVFDIQPLEKVLLTTKQTVKCKENKENKNDVEPFHDRELERP